MHAAMNVTPQGAAMEAGVNAFVESTNTPMFSNNEQAFAMQRAGVAVTTVGNGLTIWNDHAMFGGP